MLENFRFKICLIKFDCADAHMNPRDENITGLFLIKSESANLNQSRVIFNPLYKRSPLLVLTMMHSCQSHFPSPRFLPNGILQVSQQSKYTSRSQTKY